MQRKPPTPKEGLRQSLMARRQAKGDGGDTKGGYRGASVTELSPHERARKERRKEQNRRAAQRCRFKKRQNQSKVLQTFQNILDSNRDLRDEMQVLKSERDNLQLAWSSHCTACPLLSPTHIKPEVGPCSLHQDGGELKTEQQPSSASAMLDNNSDVMVAIKQETPPPLSDCMLTSSSPYQHSPTVDDEDNNAHTLLPPYMEQQYYPYNDHHYYYSTPPPQYNHHRHQHHHHFQHNHHQQHHKPTSTITPTHSPYPYPAFPTAATHPFSDVITSASNSENLRPSCALIPTPTPTPLVPYHHNQHHTHQNIQNIQNIQPNSYGYPKNVKAPCEPKHPACNTGNDSTTSAMTSPHTPSAMTSPHTPNTMTSPHTPNPMTSPHTPNPMTSPHRPNPMTSPHTPNTMTSPNTPNTMTSPNTPASPMAKATPNTAPTTNLVHKYPDLCRHLQRHPTPPTPNQLVPFGNRHTPHPLPHPHPQPQPHPSSHSPGIDPSGAIIRQIKSPYLGTPMESNHSPDSHPKHSNPRPPHSNRAGTVEHENNNNSGRQNGLTNLPTPSMAAINNCSVPGSLQPRGAGSFDNGNGGARIDTTNNVHTTSSGIDTTRTVMTPNPASTSGLVDSIGVSSSDMETESVLSTALDMETSYTTLSRDKCLGYDVMGERVKSDNNNMAANRFDEFCREHERTTPYPPVCFIDVDASSTSLDSGEDGCPSAVDEETNGIPPQLLSMADDLSGIPNKELLFFPVEMTYENGGYGDGQSHNE